MREKGWVDEFHISFLDNDENDVGKEAVANEKPKQFRWCCFNADFLREQYRARQTKPRHIIQSELSSFVSARSLALSVISQKLFRFVSTNRMLGWENQHSRSRSLPSFFCAFHADYFCVYFFLSLSLSLYSTL